MNLKRAIIIVVLAGIVFSGISGAVGWMLGTYSPEYYRTIFRREHDPDFDPVQMGLSLGQKQEAVNILGTLALDPESTFGSEHLAKQVLRMISVEAE